MRAALDQINTGRPPPPDACTKISVFIYCFNNPLIFHFWPLRGHFHQFDVHDAEKILTSDFFKSVLPILDDIDRTLNLKDVIKNKEEYSEFVKELNFISPERKFNSIFSKRLEM